MFPLASQLRQAFRIRPANSLRLALKNGKFLYYTFLAILLKSLLLLAALHAPGVAGVDIGHMFYTVPPIFSHLMIIVFFVAIGLFFKSKVRRLYLIVLNVIISLVLFCDLIYYRAYAAFLSLRFLEHPAGFNPLALNLGGFIRLFDFWFLIDLILIVCVMLVRKNRKLGTTRQSSHRHPVLAALVMAAAVSVVSYDHYRIDIKDTTNGQMMFVRMCWVPFQTMSNMSPIGYHLYDGLRLFGDNKEHALAPQERADVQAWFSQQDENLPDNAYKGKFRGKNLIIIQVESLEAFVLNEQVGGQEITPNLNRLLGSSLQFTNFYEQVNNGTSSDSDLLTTTSVFPLREGSNFYRYPTNVYNTLPKLLEGMGYQTISSHPEPAGNWNWVEAHHSIGYRKIWDLSQFNVDEQVGIGFSDESYLRQLSDKIKDQKQPFLMHFVTLSSHGPFHIPEKKQELRLSPEFNQTTMGAYFQAVHYADKQIGAFLDKLDKSGLLEQSVIAIYGDHTGVHKYYQDQINAIAAIENEEWRAPTLKLPFLVYQKGLQGETIDQVGGQVDTLPTLAYLMGVDTHQFSGTAMGKNLVNTKRNFTILNDGTLVGDQPDGREKTHILDSFKIADLVHESNFFAK
ncbi:LTA synthase family protein [Paenibacillus sp. HWE-109]|uniref:LTA synthase family protein n=1 Tax=Paenibacillus sp. HWE-109 TaxID=1306526 RepID=UPI001EDF63A1|nr:LTA synthase family protein [Paenibacillus sp. HWE-109]UKS29293.1 LTA synthase family protein [Paenibacillus sp. HWE-109]